MVTINAPLHPETEHLFDDAMFGRMKRGTYLVNTARGKICDRDAVVRALESGQLAGYAGDVWFPQPAPADHPWRTMPHEGMTPHVSGTSLSAQSRYAAGSEGDARVLARRASRSATSTSSSTAVAWPAPAPIPTARGTAPARSGGLAGIRHEGWRRVTRLGPSLTQCGEFLARGDIWVDIDKTRLLCLAE